VWSAVVSTSRRLDDFLKPRSRLLVIVAVTLLAWGLWLVVHRLR
jgi:hypothetical protein